MSPLGRPTSSPSSSSASPEIGVLGLVGLPVNTCPASWSLFKKEELVAM